MQNSNFFCGMILDYKSEKIQDTYIKEMVKSSLNYYDFLTCSEGRFSYFKCNDKLFPYAKTISTKYADAHNKNIKINNIFNTNRNVSLIGEGGTGKTTSLLKIWKELLEKDGLEKYKTIPIYIPLNDANIFKNGNFISSFCENNYGFDINNVSLSDNYKILLLLDGFNEITISGSDVADEIRQMIYKTSIRLLITSRYDFTGIYGLDGILKYYIQPLDKNTIDEYLKVSGISISKLPYELLSTPMMLTLYTNTNIMIKEISKKYIGPFFDNNRKGEVLYNFILCQFGKSFQVKNLETNTKAFIALFVISPYIGYYMERHGQFSLKKDEYRSIIWNGMKIYNAEQYKMLLSYTSPNINKFTTFIDNIKYEYVDEIEVFLTDTLAILQLQYENDKVTFRHQFFRDFFSSLHIINDIRISCFFNNKPPSTLTERIIPKYITEFIGDISQEYREYAPDRIMKRLLDFARNKKFEEIPLLCNNIINIQAISQNNNLSQENYSFLDLSKVSLNGLVFCDKNNKANFEGSILSLNTFLISGHLGQVRSAVYSQDGKKVLSAGDNTIKEWDVVTGQCIMTYYGHENLVNSALYSQSGNKILSASNDNTTREWDVETGQCINILTGHTGYVTKSVYSPDNTSIFSSSWDGKVLQYTCNEDGNWGEAHIVASHDKNVKSIAISNDGCFCLTASGDNTAKEWHINTGECVNSYLGHTDMVNSAVYSSDAENKYILTGSYDSTIRIFDRKTREQLDIFDNKTWVRNAIFDEKSNYVIIASQNDYSIKELKICDSYSLTINNTYYGHKGAVTNVSVSHDGKRILSTSEDGTIKEWDRLSGQCIKEYTGNTFSTTNTVYSKDGLKVLTINKNTFSVANRNDGIAFQHFEGCSSKISSVAFAPNGKQVLSTSEEGLWKWELESGIHTEYNCLIEDNCIPQHAAYSNDGNRIICLLKNIKKKNNEVKVYQFNEQDADPEIKFTLPIDAISIKYDDGSTFQTFSSDGIIRRWDCKSGDLIQVVGSNIQGCNFNKCILLDRTIKKIIEESKVTTNWLYIESIKLDNKLICLNGKSLLIKSDDDIKCYNYIHQLYNEFTNMNQNIYCIKGGKIDKSFKKCFPEEEYSIKRIDPLLSLYQKIQLSLDEEKVISRFLSKIDLQYMNTLKDKDLSKVLVNDNHIEYPRLLEYCVVVYILSILLRNDSNDKINPDLYYKKGIVFINHIDKLIFSNDTKTKILDIFAESFPNVQFIITSSSKIVAKSTSNSFIYADM